MLTLALAQTGQEIQRLTGKSELNLPVENKHFRDLLQRQR